MVMFTALQPAQNIISDKLNLTAGAPRCLVAVAPSITAENGNVWNLRVCHCSLKETLYGMFSSARGPRGVMNSLKQHAWWFLFKELTALWKYPSKSFKPKLKLFIKSGHFCRSRFDFHLELRQNSAGQAFRLLGFLKLITKHFIKHSTISVRPEESDFSLFLSAVWVHSPSLCSSPDSLRALQRQRRPVVTKVTGDSWVHTSGGPRDSTPQPPPPPWLSAKFPQVQRK